MTSLDAQIFSINALNWKSLAGLIVMGVVVLFSILLGMDKGFRVMPAGLAAVVFGVILLFLGSTKVVITDGKLVAGAMFYKVKVPLERLDLENVRLLSTDDPFRLRWRTNGVGWPGLSLGWFTSNGMKRVFAASSGNANRVYIPTSEKFDIVVTPSDPVAFLEAISVP